MRRFALTVLGLAALAPAARAQGRFPPDSFTNLKVLPKHIEPRTLLGTMRGFAIGLGVRCTSTGRCGSSTAPSSRSR